MMAQAAKTKKFIWRRASLPLFISVCAFVCFGIFYWFCTQTIDPIYLLMGLLLIIPAAVFFFIALLAGKNKLGESATAVLTLVLVPVLVLASLFYIFLLSMSATSVIVTDVARYERTMRLAGYSRKEQLAAFPEKIPAGAVNTVFYYAEASWQDYTQTVVLSFSASKEIIDGYANQFVKVAVGFDNANEVNKKVFDRFGEDYIKDLSADYVIYILINERGYDKKVSAVAISQEKNHIIFYAYKSIG